MVHWKDLQQMSDLAIIDGISSNKPVMIYKHSTRCGVSLTVKRNLEKSWNSELEQLLEPWYLDLLNHRDISNEIAKRYGIGHESPQILVIRNGKCIFDASHGEVEMDEVQKLLEKSNA